MCKVESEGCCSWFGMVVKCLCVSPLLYEFETGSLQTGFHLLLPEKHHEEKSDSPAECLKYWSIIILNTGSLTKPSALLRQHSWGSKTCLLCCKVMLSFYTRCWMPFKQKLKTCIFGCYHRWHHFAIGYCMENILV